MKMYTHGENSMYDLVKYVNEKGIRQEDIVCMIQDQEGTFTITYYAED